MTDCGCRVTPTNDWAVVKYSPSAGVYYTIAYCPLHEAAGQMQEALMEVSNAYGCFAGCTGSLPGAPKDGSGHTPGCKKARAALAAAKLEGE